MSEKYFQGVKISLNGHLMKYRFFLNHSKCQNLLNQTSPYYLDTRFVTCQSMQLMYVQLANRTCVFHYSFNNKNTSLMVCDVWMAICMNRLLDTER